ncbi:chloride channel protein [Monashia sp. NPDC004114]
MADEAPADTERRVHPWRYLRLVLIGLLIGIPAALVGAAFLSLVHVLEDLLWTDLPKAMGVSRPPWYLVVGLPVVGALLVLVARRLLPGDGGHEPLEGIGASPTPLAHVPGIALAAVATLAFGAVLGPEAPLIALGSATGIAVGRIARLGSRERQVVSTAGSYSAISALFGGPIVASFMLMEAGLGFGARLVPVLLPGFVAAAAGYIVFLGVNDWPGLGSASIAVGDLPTYATVSIGDIVIAVVAGIVAAVVVRAARRSGEVVLALRPRGTTLVLVGGAVVTGLLALLAQGLGATSDDVLFSGQSAIPDLLALGTDGSAALLVVLLVAKGLAFAVCLGCGFRGGPIFPAIFLGVAVAALAVAWFGMSPTAALAIGTAAGMTAMSSFLFTSVLFAALLTGTAGHDAIPLAVFAAASAWLTLQGLKRWLPDRRAPAPVA